MSYGRKFMTAQEAENRMAEIWAIGDVDEELMIAPVPASKIDGGVPASLVEKYCRPSDVRYCPEARADVKMYDEVYVKATFGLIERKRFAANAEAIKAFADYKAAKKAAPIVHTGCTVEWLEWLSAFDSSKKEYKKHRVAGCTVSVKGQFASITLPDGTTFRKKIGAAGFSFNVGTTQQ